MKVHIMDLSRSRTLWFGSFCVASFALVFWAIPAPLLGEMLNAVLFSVSLGVVITYTPAVLASVKGDKPSSRDYLLIGIWVVAASVAMRGAMSMWWRFQGKPDDLTDGFAWLFVIWLGIVGGTLHLTAPNAIDGRVPARNWLIWGASVAVGFAVLMVTMMVIGNGNHRPH